MGCGVWKTENFEEFANTFSPLSPCPLVPLSPCPLVPLSQNFSTRPLDFPLGAKCFLGMEALRETDA